jgi:hypothetical protein
MERLVGSWIETIVFTAAQAEAVQGHDGHQRN